LYHDWERRPQAAPVGMVEEGAAITLPSTTARR